MISGYSVRKAEGDLPRDRRDITGGQLSGIELKTGEPVLRASPKPLSETT